MRAKNRLSPYPILCDYSDDYQKGSLRTVICSEKDDFGHINVSVEFNLESEYLQSLIDDKKAIFVTHIECPRTCYRKSINSQSFKHEEIIDIADVAFQLEVNTFIIAIEPFEYSSEAFNDDYTGCSFDINKGNILAIGDAKSILLSDNQKLEKVSSIIKIVKVDDAEKSISVDTDDDNYIKIKLSGKVCDRYIALGSSMLVKTCFSLVLFPALFDVLTRIVASDNEGTTFNDKNWYKSLEKLLEAKKIHLGALSLSDNSIMDACQKIFEDPIAKAFDELNKRMEVIFNED